MTEMMDETQVIEQSFEQRQIELYRSMSSDGLRAELLWRSTIDPIMFDRLESDTQREARGRALAAIHARCVELIKAELASRGQ